MAKKRRKTVYQTRARFAGGRGCASARALGMSASVIHQRAVVLVGTVAKGTDEGTLIGMYSGMAHEVPTLREGATTIGTGEGTKVGVGAEMCGQAALEDKATGTSGTWKIESTAFGIQS